MNNESSLRVLSPLMVDFSACFLYERPHAPLPFSPAPEDPPSLSFRKRCRTSDEEEEAYEQLSKSLKSGSLRIPRFIRENNTNNNNSNNDTISTISPKHKPIARRIVSLEDGLKKRIRQIAQLDMTCHSLFDEMKATC